MIPPDDPLPQDWVKLGEGAFTKDVRLTPWGEGRKNWAKPDAGGWGRLCFEIIGRPKAKKFFRIFILFVYLRS